MYETNDQLIDIYLANEISLDSVGTLLPGRYRIRISETLVEIAGLLQKQTAVCWLEGNGLSPAVSPTRLSAADLATLLAHKVPRNSV